MDLSGRRLRLLIPDILGLERGSTSSVTWPRPGTRPSASGCTHSPPTRRSCRSATSSSTSGCPTSRRSWTATRSGPAGRTTPSSDSATSRSTAMRSSWTPARSCGRRSGDGSRWTSCRRWPSSSSSTSANERTGAWLPADLPSHRVYGTGMSVDPSGAVHDMVSATLGSGFAVESWCSEFDTAAFEVNWRYRDALAAADEAFLFRILVREIAARHGRHATFLGRPFNDRGGSGMHVNFSFRRQDGSTPSTTPTTPTGCPSWRVGRSRGCSPTIVGSPRSARRP